MEFLWAGGCVYRKGPRVEMLAQKEEMNTIEAARIYSIS